MPNPTRKEVIKVIRECRRRGLTNFLSLYGYQQSTRYDLIFERHRYPPKAIYNVARKRSGEDDKSGDQRGLSGGRAVNDPLRRLGFSIVTKDALEIGLDVPDGATDDYAERFLALRRGQAKFRALLMHVYSGRCTITGCSVSAVLEACHLRPYSDIADYKLSNGILLRADLHTLFDLNLIRINPESLKVIVDQSIGDREYKLLEGKSVREPNRKTAALDRNILKIRWEARV